MIDWGSFFSDRNTLADTIPDKKEWVSAELLIYYEGIVLDAKIPIGDSGLFLRNSKLVLIPL